MAEGARLESVYTATYRGFESLPHRHIQNPSRNAWVFSFQGKRKCEEDESPRQGSHSGEDELTHFNQLSLNEEIWLFPVRT